MQVESPTTAGPMHSDSGDDGPMVVVIRGVLMNLTLWDTVVEGLGDRYRRIFPELPFDAHTTPMPDDADLSLLALAAMIAEFLTELDLRHVTLVCNDWGDAQLVISPDGTDRVASLVLVSDEALDNYPPGLAGRLLCNTTALPGRTFLTAQLLGLRQIRRLPVAFGALSKRPVPEDVPTTGHHIVTMSHPLDTVYEMERTYPLRGPKPLRAPDRGPASRNSMPIADVCAGAVIDGHTGNDHQRLTGWFRNRRRDRRKLILRMPISFALALGTTYSPGFQCWGSENVYQ